MGQLLNGMRVVDMADGAGEMCGRFLADLGADVVRVEPPGGARSRTFRPAHRGTALAFVLRNANKRSLVLDLDEEAGRRRLAELLAGADAWIHNALPARLVTAGMSADAIGTRFPNLVDLSITEFGRTGPYRDWAANDWVLLAMAGMLSQSGVPGRPPLMPPGDMVEETTSIQAAWAVLLAYWNALETGAGDKLDLSRFEATAQILDPAFGSIGTAAAANAGSSTTPRGRPDSPFYPVFQCADGHVRIVMLSPRQWHGMRAWLGEPEEFTDPSFDRAGPRFRAADRLYPLIADLLREETAMALVAEGQRRGVPIAPVLSPSEVLSTDHFCVRRTFTPVRVAAGRSGLAPAGHVLVDGERAGIRSPAPAVGQHDGTVAWEPRPSSPAIARPRRPLAGLRVLDLGVIVLGGEAGRLFADQGADVIKVENRRHPDGARMSGMTGQFAVAQRNKRSLGLNLREPGGVALFGRLVAASDVVLTNFKPGTLESLGLNYERLREVNPGIVLVTSSAMGESGPWRDWMGYGPLVRCVSGLTSLWCDPAAPHGFGDRTTIYPDHFVARVVVTAALAALIRRRHTGEGAHIESSQAESIIVALGAHYLAESLDAGSAQPSVHGDLDAPWGIYQCAGDDDWCVITVRGDDDWARLVEVMGCPAWALDQALQSTAGRIAARVLIDEALGTWTATLAPREAAASLQAAGVPAGMMMRTHELLSDPHLRERGFFRTMRQPGLMSEVTTENGPCSARDLPEPTLQPAPFHGQHTRQIAHELLGLSDDEVDALLERGILEETAGPDVAMPGQAGAQ